jgi:hypothetical protein
LEVHQHFEQLQRSMPPTSIRHIGDTATLLSGSRNGIIEHIKGLLLSRANPSISGDRVIPFERTSDQLTAFHGNVTLSKIGIHKYW